MYNNKMNLISTLLLLLSLYVVHICPACDQIQEEDSTNLLHRLITLINKNNGLLQYLLNQYDMHYVFHVRFRQYSYSDIANLFLRKDFELFPKDKNEFIKEVSEHIETEEHIETLYENLATLNYNLVAKERKQIMKKIFIKFFRRNLTNHHMCNENVPNDDIKCKFVGLVLSTENHVIDWVYSPHCVGKICHLRPRDRSGYLIDVCDPGEFKERKVNNPKKGMKDSVIEMKSNKFRGYLDW
ncbi:uncharacterized protein LOC126902426 isoform X2 [Daktulosphaira vitifoliae]|uniref:uncharacterized protein LOC126902426 isoform X2 n=1 Tax=Daktulosphaira vitifoliae TaxID=58002 RepID=UPI0021A97DD1|nr:uncharacterized protein LOC126902426 isoform X2 [Daktulosphaira vitifoliae]